MNILDLFREKKEEPAPIFPVFKQTKWDEMDSVALKEFLLTQTGKRFMDGLLVREAYACSNACGETMMNREFQAGVAMGIRQVRNSLFTFSKTVERQENAEAIVYDDQTPSEDDLDQALEDMVNNTRKEPVLG